MPVVQVPAHANCFSGPGSFRAATYADIREVCGYADRERLTSILTAWEGALGEVRPDVVIRDYSPLLSLAVFGRRPLITIGDGFVCPPDVGGAFPPLSNALPPIWPPEMLLENAVRCRGRWPGLNPRACRRSCWAWGRWWVCCQPSTSTARRAGVRQSPAFGLAARPETLRQQVLPLGSSRLLDLLPQERIVPRRLAEALQKSLERQFVAAVRSAAPEQTPSVGEWADWALAVANAIDPEMVLQRKLLGREAEE